MWTGRWTRDSEFIISGDHGRTTDSLTLVEIIIKLKIYKLLNRLPAFIIIYLKLYFIRVPRTTLSTDGRYLHCHQSRECQWLWGSIEFRFLSNWRIVFRLSKFSSLVVMDLDIPENSFDRTVFLTMGYKGYKLGCVVRMVVDSLLSHPENGPNDHRKDAPQFIWISLIFRKWPFRWRLLRN